MRMGPGGLWLAGFAVALALYVSTLAPDLDWQDSGDYQFEAARLNLSRPGDAVRVHPWFLVAAHALGRIRLWNYAYAANLASAVGTAIAVANVLVLARLATGRALAAVLAAATFAVGHAVWAHAVMAETYGWAAAFLSAECLCAWAFLTDRRPRWLPLLFLINGAAISNHMMAVLSMAVFGVWMLCEVVRRRAAWWVVPGGAACWIIGGALYWVVLGMEYGRTGSLVETFRSATVGRWGSEIFNLADLPRLCGKSLLYVGLNYPTPLILAIPLGAARLFRRRDTFSWLILVLAAMYFLWAARYNVADQYAFFIPFYVPASVLMGVGAARLTERLKPLSGWMLAAGAALLPVAVYAALPQVAPPVAWAMGVKPFRRNLPYRDAYRYFLEPWKNGDWSARRFAEETFAVLPPRAVLIPDSTASPPLLCLQKIEGRRPDVVLATPEGAPGAVVRHYWSSRTDLLPEAVRDGRRIFVVSNHPDYPPPWVIDLMRLEPFGCIFEVRPRLKEDGR